MHPETSIPLRVVLNVPKCTPIEPPIVGSDSIWCWSEIFTDNVNSNKLFVFLCVISVDIVFSRVYTTKLPSVLQIYSSSPVEPDLFRSK